MTADKARLNKADKLLTQYARLVQQQGKRIPDTRLAALNEKRDARTITSRDLPGSLQSEFPSELADLTLQQIRDLREG